MNLSQEVSLMYKKLIALSALGLAMSAQAQTNVIIYGYRRYRLRQGNRQQYADG